MSRSPTLDARAEQGPVGRTCASQHQAQEGAAYQDGREHGDRHADEERRGKTDDDGKKIFLEVKAGDRVLVSKYGGTEIKLDGKDYRIFNGDEVLAVIDN